MKIKDITNIFSQWAHPNIKFKNDPYGLLIGDYEDLIHKTLISLNITPEVVEEAISENCNLIITHHPLFYSPVKSLIRGDYYSDIITALVRNKINLISYHTALDMAIGGVNFSFAEFIGLKNIQNLIPANKLNASSEKFLKLIVYTPLDFCQIIKDSINSLNTDIYDNYDYCFFETEGNGFFRPQEKANPYLGTRNQISQIPEVKIETIILKRNLAKIIKKIKEVHPYEEVAYDIFELQQEPQHFGLGSIGVLREEKSIREFLKDLSQTLKTEDFRIMKSFENVRKVAILTGSGEKFINYAIQKGADTVITSEVGHHSFLELHQKINIIDINHHDSEFIITKKIFNFLREKTNLKDIKISEKDQKIVEIFKDYK